MIKNLKDLSLLRKVFLLRIMKNKNRNFKNFEITPELKSPDFILVKYLN